MYSDQRIDEDIIVIGDRVDLVVKTGQVYRAMIEDRIDNGPFLVGIPSSKGIPMHVESGDDIYLVFYRETGRYIAQMNVVALENRGAIRYMWLLQKTKAQQNQRRGAFRLPVSLNVHIRKYEEDEEDIKKDNLGLGLIDEPAPAPLEEANTRDISVTGISLLTKKKYALDEKFILSMDLDMTPAIIRVRQLPISTTETILTATVKRCIPWRTDNMFNTGMHYFGLTKSMSESIAKYVLTEQQKRVKRVGWHRR